VKRPLLYKPAAQRELNRMDRSDAERIIHALEVFATIGHGDVKALKGALKGRYRLRVGKWRALPDGRRVPTRSASR
jgi:mRNA-degrading endonuclease RelE of RelBE toxin-antitoxin system